MTHADILIILKDDLMVSGTDLDALLGKLIEYAEDLIKDEGIVLDAASVRDGMLVEQYAAFLYRKRKEQNFVMPRSLRWALNNRKFKPAE